MAPALSLKLSFMKGEGIEPQARCYTARGRSIGAAWGAGSLEWSEWPLSFQDSMFDGSAFTSLSFVDDAFPAALSRSSLTFGRPDEFCQGQISR